MTVCAFAMKLSPLAIMGLVVACEKTEWIDHPPKEFQGTFYQVSDEIIHGDEQPLIFQITDTELKWRKGREMLDSATPMAMSHPILAVSRTGNSIVIFCGESRENEYRYELGFGKGHFLYINSIVPDLRGNDVKFSEGVFTRNNYLKFGLEAQN